MGEKIHPDVLRKILVRLDQGMSIQAVSRIYGISENQIRMALGKIS